MRAAQSDTGINRGTLRRYMNREASFYSNHYGCDVSVADHH